MPEMLLRGIIIDCIVEILKISNGIGPVNLFSPIPRNSRYCRLPISLGIAPGTI
jgi:hypothetical protein